MGQAPPTFVGRVRRQAVGQPQRRAAVARRGSGPARPAL